jgi:Spy/CpxP family protein refolding chaperone
MPRRILPLLFAALVIAACDRGPTESAPVDAPSFEVVLESMGEGASAAMLLDRAPAELRLTAAQREAIRALNTEFQRAHRADVEALRTTTRLAMQARRDGKSPEEVRAILEASRPVRERLGVAFAELHRAVQAVLTDAQRAWLREHSRRLGAQLPPLPPLPPRRS